MELELDDSVGLGQLLEVAGCLRLHRKPQKLVSPRDVQEDDANDFRAVLQSNLISTYLPQAGRQVGTNLQSTVA